MRSIEDLGTVIVDHHSTHLTIPLINLLAQNNVRVVFCNEQHMPVTMLMDLDSNILQSKHFRAQLADDLMEPYRPFVDELVRELFFRGEVEITQAVKRRMVEEYYERLSQDEISATAHSLVHVFERENNILYYPKFK